MNIISQFYKNMLKERIKSKISSISDELVDIIVSSIQYYDKYKYLNLINSIQEKTSEIIKTIIIETFEEIDEQFKNSSERKLKYNINKSSVSRTLITIVGEITFTRTYYISKLDGTYHFLIDELFQLPAYDHYDPIVKAIAIDKAFNTNQSQAGKDVGEQLISVSSLTSKNRNKFHISRQSVWNWINDWNVPNFVYEKQDTPNTLYVMADEKFLGCQDLDNDIMSKCMIAFEDVKDMGKGRRKLINKTIYSTYSNKPWDEFTNVLAQKYDFSKIDNIILLGDGGNWIKSGKQELKIESNNTVEYRLCNFHFKQAINRITSDKDIRKTLIEIFNNKSKKEFENEINKLIEKEPNKKDNITKNLTYISNNYKAIKAMIASDIGSSMESHISHCISNLFSSRPKGYSSLNIKQYLKISNFKNNNLNILDLYLRTYNNDEVTTINQDEFDYSIFDKKGSNLPIIDYGKVSGTFTLINSILGW